MNPYPLKWPYGWPRNDVPESWPHKTKLGTIAAERSSVLRQLKGIKATLIATTSNGRLSKKTGELLASQPKLSQPGVAVYFKLGLDNYVVACDRYTTLAGNLRGISETLATMRTIGQKHSAAMMRKFLSILIYSTFFDRPEPDAPPPKDRSQQRQQTGQQQRKQPPPPPPPKDPPPKRPAYGAETWARTLQVSTISDLTWEQVKAAYRRLSLKHHPDKKGGDTSMMQQINAAYLLAKIYFNQT